MKAAPIKKIIKEIFNNTKLEEINKITKIEEIWKRAVGKTISNKTEIESFINGKLIVKVKSPIWRNELFLQKKEIIKKINKNKQINKIIKIIFK